MTKEEMILPPAMRAGGGAGIAHPSKVMRADDNDNVEYIALTGNCRVTWGRASMSAGHGGRSMEGRRPF